MKKGLISAHMKFPSHKGCSSNHFWSHFHRHIDMSLSKGTISDFLVWPICSYTRHSRLRAKPRAGIIALKVPGSVGTRGYVCMGLKIHSPTRELPDRHRRTCQNYHVHVPSTKFDSIQWNSLEPLSQRPKGRKYNQGNQTATNEWLYQISTIITLVCWCGKWFFFRTMPKNFGDSGGLDFRRVGTVRQNVILHYGLLRATFHKRSLVKPGTNTNLAEVKTGNKLDETMLLCYTKL